MDHPKFEELNPANCREVSIKIHYPEFWEFLHNKYPGLPFAEKIYLFYHNLEQPPVCSCGNKTAFLGFRRGYREFCSYKCMNSCKDIQERKKRTSLKNNGTEIPMHSQQVRAKLKVTNMERYGVENAFQSKVLMEKSKQTCLEKYGTEYANQSEEVKQKILESRRQKITEKYKGIINIESGDGIDIYTMDCPDRNCNKCTEKCFRIGSNTLYDRTRIGADLCTNRSPVGGHIKNTSLEIFVRRILDECSVVYETNNRSILHGKELDIYIPDKKLAIECNGVYWHAMYDSGYHYEKWKQCSAQGIQLLTIWEDWITNKPEIVESLIRSKLGIYKHRIFARQCKIRSVSSVDARRFLDANHIQGYCNNSIKLGLYYQGELVSIMTFSPASSTIMRHRQTDGQEAWVLSRFCTKLNMQVVGGAERLLKYFLKGHPVTVISFASHDISNGHLYEKLGFREACETRTNYWYIHNQTHKRFHRSTFTKGVLVKLGYDPSLTEEQIMMTTDYLRIYDSGQTKYILQ